MELVPLLPASPTYAEAERLYLEAFPEEERRPAGEWRALMAGDDGAFRALEIREADAFAGFVTYWKLDGFVYIEHFAIDSRLRGGGLGGRVVERLKRTLSPQPLVLEAEHPVTEMAGRRIAFYVRHGFVPMDTPYFQPPYRRGGRWVPLVLMTSHPVFCGQNYEAIRASIYRNVYHVETEKE